MHYNKEIEMLRARLADAERKIATEEEEKVSIQENLKKAFMRGVCAMNFEAMNILNPSLVENGTSVKIKTPTKEIPEFTEKNESFEYKERIPLDEISAVLPSDSKEMKWKAAPIFGRPATAPEKPNVIEYNYSGLPTISNTNSQGEGKIIVVNNAKAGEAKITGKVPIKPAIGTKIGK